MAFFTVSKRSSKSKARLATIQTGHGVITTPSFVPCATKATLKAMHPSHIGATGVELAFVNTYHLAVYPGPDVLEKAGGVHTFSRLPISLMSDSGGFQVFSLGRADQRRAQVRQEPDEQPLLIKISEDGVKFRSTHDGAVLEFTPESSMYYQKQIGADLVMAFDECTYLEATHAYAKKAMDRTHDWLVRCIIEMKKTDHMSITSNPVTKPHKQYLYGIIQGGQYQDLREASATYIAQSDVAGVAIGGVSVGESKLAMREQVAWCAPYLPSDKPVHLLGVGQFDDIWDLVGMGIDTFDCVEPTRISRMGIVYQWKAIEDFMDERLSGVKSEVKKGRFEIDLTKQSYKTTIEPIDTGCSCEVCVQYTKAYLHHLFKSREMLGYTLATTHNLYTMERFMGLIREYVKQDKL